MLEDGKQVDSKSIETVLKIAKQLEKKEAIDTVIMDMSKTRLLTDYFVICTANSSIHMKSLRDDIVDYLNELGKQIIYYDRGEGYDWILVDAGDIVIHIFTKSARQFYDIEHLWIDVERIDIK
ncbi:MAG TPA: ribosome silencing factor [Fervidobacterium sp.]|mgnify:FL=1|nr:ribosome silencing factor [Fervidobacterium sp.]HPT53979.1 ribosome silencing factor [Fervidobacterium sp.]HPZ18280.1 ribosome silencing factor [Fervidobacterium sp.]HQE48572.1 ribosome silencing factor [Fervidobacterium sp.]HUM43460.1 ribosome silencing factor [Fervidobacterium sp.]